MRTLTIFSLLAVSAFAQQLQPPQVGFALAADHSVHPVYGVAGNFVLGRSIAAHVFSSAFSGSLGILKTDTALAAFDSQGRVMATTPVEPGDAIFAFSTDRRRALVYIRASNTLFEFRDGTFVLLPFRPALPRDETIIAVALPNAFEVSIFYERSNSIAEVRIPLDRVHPASQNAVTDIEGPVLVLASRVVVFSDAKGIVVWDPDGSEIHIPAQLPARFSFQQMSADWVLLNDLESPRRFAIRITRGCEGFYQLPEAAPEANQ
jgi:hypothetical protein